MSHFKKCFLVNWKRIMDKLDRFDLPVVTIYIQIYTVYIHMVYIWYIFIYIIFTVVGNAVT